MSAYASQPSKEHLLLEDVFTKVAESIDAFECYPQPHAARVAAVADELATHFHLGAEDRFSLRIAALAHDIGELAMKRDYINKPEPLTQEDRLDLSRHPILGEQEAAQAGANRGTQLLIRWHHEWWSGGGYPDSMTGEQIPLGARILRLADSYISLTDARPFRPAFALKDARQTIISGAGIEFDPRVVRAFLSLKVVDVQRTAEDVSTERTL